MSGKHYFEVRYWWNGTRYIEIHATEKSALMAAKWINDIRDKSGTNPNASRAVIHTVYSSHDMIAYFRALKKVRAGE